MGVSFCVGTGRLFSVYFPCHYSTQYCDGAVILNKRINPSYKLGWTMLIMAFPVFGLLLYLLFGHSRIAEEMQKRYTRVQEDSIPYLQSDPRVCRKIQEEDPSAAVQSEYICRHSVYPVYEHTKAEYFQVGDDMFPVLVKELEQAEHYIYIEYFIINDGVMWRTILDILEQKAAQGVDVRLIYDGFGCLTTLPYKYDKFLREKGIQCKVFNPFRPVLNIIQNNRDHRKICVIDGRQALQEESIWQMNILTRRNASATGRIRR